MRACTARAPRDADRIETGTFLVAAAATGGNVRLRDTRAGILDAVIDKLREAGAQIEAGRTTGSACRMPAHTAARSSLRTAPYPAFPTDMQAQFMALNSVAAAPR